MVTQQRGRRRRRDDVARHARAGHVADIAIFDGDTPARTTAPSSTPSREDVVLVMRGGKVLYGDATLSSARWRTASLRRRSTCAARRSRSACMTRDRQDAAPALPDRRRSDLPARSSAARRPTNEPTLHAVRARRRSTGSTHVHRRASPPTTRTATASPTRTTTARRCSTRSARWTTASRPTPTATAWATRATRARSTPTRRPARVRPDDIDGDGVPNAHRQLPRRRQRRPGRRRQRRQGRRLRRVPDDAERRPDQVRRHLHGAGAARSHVADASRDGQPREGGRSLRHGSPHVQRDRTRLLRAGRQRRAAVLGTLRPDRRSDADGVDRQQGRGRSRLRRSERRDDPAERGDQGDGRGDHASVRADRRRDRRHQQRGRRRRRARRPRASRACSSRSTASPSRT